MHDALKPPLTPMEKKKKARVRAVLFSFIMGLIAFWVSYKNSPFTCPQKVTAKKIQFFQMEIQYRMGEGTWNGDITSLHTFGVRVEEERDYLDAWDRPFDMEDNFLISRGQDGFPGGKGVNGDIRYYEENYWPDWPEMEARTPAQFLIQPEAYTPFLVIITCLFSYWLSSSSSTVRAEYGDRFSKLQWILYFIVVLFMTGFLAMMESIMAGSICIPTH